MKLVSLVFPACEGGVAAAVAAATSAAAALAGCRRGGSCGIGGGRNAKAGRRSIGAGLPVRVAVTAVAAGLRRKFVGPLSFGLGLTPIYDSYIYMYIYIYMHVYI